MRLFARTLLFFLGAISIQAVLTAGLIIGLVSRNSQNTAVIELQEESDLVYENYYNWVRVVWKFAVGINEDEEIRRLALSVNNGENETRLGDALNAGLRESGLDSYIIRTTENNRFIVLSDAYPFVKNFQGLDADREHPYVALRLIEGETFLTGTISLPGNVQVFLLKNLDEDFFNQLKGREHTRILISSDQGSISHTFGSPDALAEIVSGPDRSRPFRIYFNRTIGSGHYNLTVQSVSSLANSVPEEAAYLVVLLSTEPYRTLLAQIGRIVFLVSLAIFVLTAFMALFFSGQITRPIAGLVSAMRRIRDGDYETSLEINASGEVKGLIEGFNEMADHLERNRLTMEDNFKEITFLKDYNETIIHSLRAGILVVDDQLTVEKANGFFLESFPQSGLAAGVSMEDLIIAVMDPEISRNARKIATGRMEPWSKIKREGGTVWDIKLYPLRFAPSGREGRCVVEFDDISQKIELEEKILQAEKLTSLGFLSAGIAHEINNPLSTILSNAQHLLSRPHDSDDRVCLEWIEQETNRIAGIVRELLDFAHATGGGIQASELNGCATEVIRLVRYGLSPETGVVIELTTTPNLPRVMMPPEELRQILLNLIQNAVHAVGGEGVIQVKTFLSSENQVSILISDNGPGIPEDVQPRIFDPFFTTKPDGVGTGLGLSIVFGFVNKAGGHISVESNREKGTTFTLKLPSGG